MNNATGTVTMLTGAAINGNAIRKGESVSINGVCTGQVFILKSRHYLAVNTAENKVWKIHAESFTGTIGGMTIGQGEAVALFPAPETMTEIVYAEKVTPKPVQAVSSPSQYAFSTVRTPSAQYAFSINPATGKVEMDVSTLMALMGQKPTTTVTPAPTKPAVTPAPKPEIKGRAISNGVAYVMVGKKWVKESLLGKPVTPVISHDFARLLA